jgi:HK97 family phage portal protein
VSLFRAAERRSSGFTYSGTYNPFENPAVPLASVGLDNVFGRQNNDAGMDVTPDTAASVGTFYRCLFLLSSVVAGCPIEVFRGRDHEKIDNSLFDPANVDMTYTQFELWQLVMVYRLVWGDSFVFKKRDGYDRIIDLKPIYPELVKVDLDRKTGDKVFLVKRLRPDGTIDEAAEPIVYTDWEVMHVPGMGYNGFNGLPIAKLMAQPLGTAMAADKLAGRFYSAGTMLGGIIKVKAPLRSQTQAEGIKNRWMQKNAGVGHAGDVAILDAETDFQDITIPPDQLQFLESRRWQTTEIARWFGVPPHLVGDVEKSTSWGTGIEVQNLGLHTYTLMGHTTPIEQRLSREIVQTRGQFAKFNYDSLMRGTTQERFQALNLAAGGPWLTRNEARASEDKTPLDNAEYDELLPPPGISPLVPPGTPGSPGPANPTPAANAPQAGHSEQDDNA